MPSAMEPGSPERSNTREPPSSLRSSSSGKRQSAWGPKARSTSLNERFILSAISGRCTEQPHTATICPGWRRFVCVRAPRFPRKRCSACSRMAQVFMTMMSAAFSSVVNVQPISAR